MSALTLEIFISLPSSLRPRSSPPFLHTQHIVSDETKISSSPSSSSSSSSFPPRIQWGLSIATEDPQSPQAQSFLRRMTQEGHLEASFCSA